MDPDIPRRSIENEDLADAPPLPSLTKAALDVNAAAAAIPLRPSSPLKSPFVKARSPATSSSAHKLARSPSSASSYGERQTTPTLQSKRSTSNLSVSRATTPSRTQFRRTSSNLNPASPVASFKSIMSTQEPPLRKVLTPATVAKDYFKKDLDLHQDSQSRVAVIVHDSCYGHRFSRPRTSKTSLNSIVERPERIHATLLGVAMAYVRLGGRHAQSRYPPHPERQAPPQSVPFEIRKTSRFHPLKDPSVTHVHGSKWMEELQIMCDTAEGKLAMNGKELSRPIGYGKDENGNPLPKLHEGDLYLCAESLAALEGCLGGVCEAVDAVCGPTSTQRAFVCIRPPGHHCSSNIPSGFCWLNNVHVGIAYGAINQGLTHAAIIDFDLHHGDGSQSITWDHNRKAQTMTKKDAAYKKTPIGYYSVHDINSFPCEDGDENKIRNASVCIENAHGQSIWNLHFGPWKDHAEFWSLYRTRYLVLLEKARNFLRHHSVRLRQNGVQPKATVFLSAGFDASEWEMPGMQRHAVNVPTDFYAQFTADIVKMSQEEDLGVDGRVISVLEGGYSDRALTSGVLSHLCGLIEEPSINIPIQQQGGLASSVATHLGNGTFNGVHAQSEVATDRYDSSWWESHKLETIEAIVLGNMPPPPKATKEKSTGNYSSPTHASTNRMAEVAKERRSLSAQLEARLSLENDLPPPPPEVDWAIAAYELSRLFIPGDRQTLSCRHEELNAEATRARKERQSAVGVTAAEAMQLRERRPKPPPIPSSTVRSSSRSSTRRTTIASVNDLPDPSFSQAGGEVIPSTRPRRRSSASSSILSGFQDMNLDDGIETKPTWQASGETSTNNLRSRAGSVVTMKPLAQRKTKAPATSKPQTRPRTSPRKANARSRPGSSSSDRTNTSRATSQQPVIAAPPPPSVQNPNANVDNTSNIDSIATGMKKVSIKLKVPTAEEHAAKQKKAEEQAKASTIPKPARKPPVVRVVKPKSGTKGGTGKPPEPQLHARPEPGISTTAMLSDNPSLDPAVDINPPANDHAPQVADTRNPTTTTATATPTETFVPWPSAQAFIQPDPVPVTSASHPSANPASAMQLPELPTAATGFNNFSNDKENTMPEETHMKLEGTTASSEDPSYAKNTEITLENAPLRPQNDGPVSSGPPTLNKRTKDDLPKFTSSSPIPFAGASSGTNFPAGEQQEQQVKQEGGSIWDIPETPQRQ